MWEGDEHNQRLLNEIREAVADSGRVLVFLGAGVSFGAARGGSRSEFDGGRWQSEPLLMDKNAKDGKPPRPRGPKDPPRPPRPPTIRLLDYDDGQPLPSWKMLMSRMRKELALARSPHEQDEISDFFEDQDYLDCAQLFRSLVGEPVYFDFLKRQFACPDGRVTVTPSHLELVRLNLPVVFTTNYDPLIERAHIDEGVELTVSADETDFKQRMTALPPRHLVKLHGTIDRPNTVVLTRDDYARSRAVRREMFSALRFDLMRTNFLFVGFSLNDPNVNILLDDARVALDGVLPLSYTVQAGRNRIKEQYLQSLGIRTVWLDEWGQLPWVLRRINPAVPV